MSISPRHARNILGGTVYGAEGEKIGTVGTVYLDDRSGRPEWVTVCTGLFGTYESFVPLVGAAVYGTDVTVGFDEDTVTGAPRVDPTTGSLSEAQEQQIYRYYGLERVEPSAPWVGGGTIAAPGVEDVGAGRTRLRTYDPTETEAVRDR